MIVGTAGHIDHGKTTLVRALTGVDTDRLPEEKARGISIELGYAYLDAPGVDAGGAPPPERIGFIDAPGHERLVHTMLAGATGIDFCLLLVAADDGVMPQTREHLAVCSLLGLTRGAVVISKADRADAARLEQVRADIAALLQGTPLAGAPVFPVSAHSGAGMAALRAFLFDTARAMPRRSASGLAFRLAIDRVFTLAGIGTVAAGTIHTGQIAVGDEITLAPAPSAPALLGRVRSLHAQNRAVTQAQAGQRCAVALAGIGREQVARGQWLVARGSDIATSRLDAELTLWHDEPNALRSGTPVHVHVGAASVMGAVAVLHRLDTAAGGPPASESSLPPGGAALVQLVLREPIAAWHGDRMVLRDNSARRTLAGGRVLDPFAPTRYRRTPQRLAELAAWRQPGAAARLAGLIAAAPFGLSLREWSVAEGLPDGMCPALPGDALRADGGAQGAWALGGPQCAALRDAVIQTLAAFHEREPDTLGPDASRLRRLAAPRLPQALWAASLAAQARIVQTGAFVHLPEHGLRLSANDQRLAQKMAPWMAAAGFEGAWVRDLAKNASESEALLRAAAARLAQCGELHQIVKDLYYAPETIIRLAAILRGLAAACGGEVMAGRFRDETGLGRKRAIQLLEYFDRVGLLRRVGDAHRLRSDTNLFAGPSG